MGSKETYTEFNNNQRPWDVCNDGRRGHEKMELLSTEGIVRLELQNAYTMFDNLSYTVSTSFEGTEADLFRTVIFTDVIKLSV